MKIAVISKYIESLGYDVKSLLGVDVVSTDRELVTVQGHKYRDSEVVLEIDDKVGQDVATADRVIIYGRHTDDLRSYIKFCKDFGVESEKVVFILCGCGGGDPLIFSVFSEEKFVPAKIVVAKNGSDAGRGVAKAYLSFRGLAPLKYFGL